MAKKIWSSKDFYAGIMFIAFGVITLLLARGYKMGTASRMGPGYFPATLGGALAILGLVIAVRPFWVSGEMLKRWGIRPLLLVIGSIVGFGLLLRPMGLVLATVMMVITSCLGSDESRVGEVAVLSLVLVGIAVVLFAWGLGIPFTIWPF